MMTFDKEIAVSEERYMCIRDCYHNSRLFFRGETNIPRGDLGERIPRHFEKISRLVQPEDKDPLPEENKGQPETGIPGRLPDDPGDDDLFPEEEKEEEPVKEKKDGPANEGKSKA